MITLILAIIFYNIANAMPDNKGKRRAQHLSTSFAPKK